MADPRQVQELTENPVGAQIVIGVNPGPALDVRDAEGVTRYQRVQQVLGAWARHCRRARLRRPKRLTT